MAFFLTLLLWVAVFALSELLKPKPQFEDARPAGLGDFQFPTATQGRVVPLLWGTCKIKGPNVVWYGDLQQIPIKEKVKTGMFSSTSVIKGYEYRVGVQMAICRGGTTPVQKLLKVWVGDDVAWDTGLTGAGSVVIDDQNFFGGEDLGNGGLEGTFNFLDGSKTQAVNTYLTAFQAEGGDTPAYRGTSYVVLEDFYLGNSTSIAPWAFEAQRIPNGLALGDPTVNTFDANPANVIYEILTDADWGLGFPVGDIDTVNLAAVAATLKAENNGFSMVLDRVMEISDFLKEVERQIDGIVVLDRNTGKWIINLARGGYNIDTIIQADASSVVEVDSFARGGWEETSNIVNIQFIQRSNEYSTSFATAQDSGNIRIQNIPITVKATFPGVKDPALANSIAWRDLRGISRPLAKVRLQVDRSFYAENPGDVFAWTDANLGITKLGMRITKIDLGTLDRGAITLDAVEDIYTFETASFDDPPVTDWTEPADTMVDVPVADRVAVVAPKALVDRAPEGPGIPRRVLWAMRAQGDNATVYDLLVGTNVVGTGSSFVLAGRLAAATPEGPQNTTIELEPNPDTAAKLLNSIDTRTTEEVGKQLFNIGLIGTEFIGFTGITDLTGNVRLDGVRRGLFDSRIETHADEARVWILEAGATITDQAFEGASVSIKPIPKSQLDELASGSATATVVTMTDRHLNPYPPVNLLFNTANYPTANVDLATANSGADDGDGILLAYTRRDFRTGDEVLAVTNETSLPNDFPAANTTEYEIEVWDVTGTPALLYTVAFQNAASVVLSRTEILRYMAGVIPTDLRVVIATRHTVDTVVITHPTDISFDFPTEDTELAGLVNFGALNENVTSAQWTNVPDTGTYSFTIAQDVLTGGELVEGQINGGGWTTIMSAGQVAGNLAGVTATDTIEVRHTKNGANTNQTIIKGTAPSAGLGAYGVFII